MYYLPVAFGVWLHVLFWGTGLSLWVMPKRWSGYWLVVAWPAGFALQSAVVWSGAYADLPGTNAYAWWSELVPLALLAIGLRKRGGEVRSGLWKFRGLIALMAVNLVAVILPLAFATRGLTTLSLGSCDAADYAAGARVFQEFAHSEREGFLGLTEVVRVASADNFFDFWLRLNHFTPSALIALNGTIFDCSPAELTSIMTVVLLVGAVPVVFWIARSVLRYDSCVSLWVAAIYGFSPITWYAVFHVAMGQLLAAPAIGLVTWVGVICWRGTKARRQLSAYFGVLVVTYSLILGSYNFILLVCLAPAAAYAGGLAIWRRSWRELGRWWLAMTLPLVVAGLFFWTRVAGLVERFQLFQTYDFGWRIPALSPEGWLGLVLDHELAPLSLALRIPIVTLILVATGLAWVRAVRQRRVVAYTLACLSLPVLAGYAYLQLRGAMLGTNASYDAYKILSVFYPSLLPAAAFWAAAGLAAGTTSRWLTIVAMLAVLTGNLGMSWHFAQRVQIAPLTVNRELTQLQALEKRPEVGSVNLMVADAWSRLWANALLLRKPQFFETHTYEGRLNTPLRGEWDLVGGFLTFVLPDGGSRQLSAHYGLVDARSPYLLRGYLGDGWFEPEQAPRSTERWIWTKGEVATLKLRNPGRQPQAVRVVLSLRAREARDLEIWCAGKRHGTFPVGLNVQRLDGPTLSLPPGESVIELRSVQPVIGSTADSRPLGFCIYQISFEVVRRVEGAASE